MDEHGTAPDSDPGVDDATVPWRVFLAVGVLVAVLAAIYWFTAYEDAGTVLLGLSAVLALWCGLFLWTQVRARRRADLAGPSERLDLAPEVEPYYLPHASVWPFVMGLGGALILNGMVLGTWVLVPGVGLTALGTAGFVRQTRRRD
jgi:Cytochrome c oxidase subunit IV